MPAQRDSPASPITHQPIRVEASYPKPIEENISDPHPVRKNASYPQPMNGDTVVTHPIRDDNTYSQPMAQQSDLSQRDTQTAAVVRLQTGEGHLIQPITDTDHDPIGDEYTGSIPGGVFVTVEKHIANGDVDKHITSTPISIKTGETIKLFKMTYVSQIL